MAPISRRSPAKPATPPLPKAAPGLRERQKADRRGRILAIAKRRFRTEGYGAVTIEAIATEVGLSAVTVYKYYGSKPGLLLALVRESDQLLIGRLKRMIAAEPDDLIETVARFAQIMRRHAMRYLSKPTWRQVLAASIQEGSGEFGHSYLALDQVLIDLLQQAIEAMKARGGLPNQLAASRLADTLFALQNMRFFQFIADDDISDAAIDRTLRADLGELRRLFGG